MRSEFSLEPVMVGYRSHRTQPHNPRAQSRGFGLGSLDRIQILIISTLALSALISGRLFYLQVLQHGALEAKAESAQRSVVNLPPLRGEIDVLDSQGGGQTYYPLAITRTLQSVFAVPREMKDKEEAVKLLAPLVDMEEDELRSRLSRDDDPFVPLAKKLEPELVEAIKLLEISGIHFQDDIARYYPENTIASQVVGFVRFDGSRPIGQYGIESYYDRLLSGEFGKEVALRDVAGRVIPVGEQELLAAKNGLHVVLTLDRTLEYKACQALEDAVQAHGADSGTVIITNPFTGEIRALCNYPSFDPNEYSNVENPRYYNNSAVNEAYEPGSVFKIITMAAGLETGAVTPNTTYIDTGALKIGPYTIRNAADKVYGRQDMIGVLKDSINTGAVFVAEKVGIPRFKKTVEDFGFGQITGVEQKPESAGTIRSLEQGGEIYIATAAFGQGITTTPIQLVQAFGAVANGGILVPPVLVKEFRTSDGLRIPFPAKSSKRVISSRAATLLSSMMVEVVRNGHAKGAAVHGYFIAGKTGTAQIAETNRRGYSGRYNHTFIGFGPVEHPDFLILTKLVNPKALYAESTAVPLAGELEAFILEHDSIAPSVTP